MSILETRYKEVDGENVLTEEEAIDICVRAIEAGIYEDLGSGSCVDFVVIKKGEVNYNRNHKADNHKLFDNPDGYDFPIGTTEVLGMTKVPLHIEEGQAPMELQSGFKLW